MSLVVNQASFNQEVLKSSIPVVVSFWAPWCGVCKLVGPILSEIHTHWDGQIKIVSINADDNLKLANLYKLKSLPTLMVFDQGIVQCRFEHFSSRKDFRTAATDLQTALEAIMERYSCSAPA